MAHVSKFSRGQSVGMTRHYKRYQNENGEYIKFGNQEIDTGKTHLNYNLAPEQNQLDFIKKRTSEVKCLNRKDVNVMCNWVVTAPQSVQGDTRQEESFFKETYKFLTDKYGEKNVVSAFIHKDETTPHMHFSFIPIVIDTKKNIEKVSAKELLTKKHLQQFHSKLEQHMEKAFGQELGILNGATANGNLSITELKLKTAQEKLSHLEQQATNKQGSIEVLVSQEEALQGKIGALEKELAGKVLTRKGFHAIKPEKTITGALKNITLEDFQNLKKTLDTYYSRTEKLEYRVKELDSDNEILKTKIPTMDDRIQSAKLMNYSKQLYRENGDIKSQLKELKEWITELPQGVQDFISDKYDALEQEQERNHDFDLSL